MSPNTFKVWKLSHMEKSCLDVSYPLIFVPATKVRSQIGKALLPKIIPVDKVYVPAFYNQFDTSFQKEVNIF